jgi:hypothetical protein
LYSVTSRRSYAIRPADAARGAARWESTSNRCCNKVRATAHTDTVNTVNNTDPALNQCDSDMLDQNV